MSWFKPNQSKCLINRGKSWEGMKHLPVNESVMISVLDVTAKAIKPTEQELHYVLNILLMGKLLLNGWL